MPGLLSILFTLAIVAVLVWVIYQLIVSFPSYGVPTVRMLAIAALVIVVIFILASVFSIPVLGGLRLK
jgi:hypothetical protein